MKNTLPHGGHRSWRVLACLGGLAASLPLGAQTGPAPVSSEDDTVTMSPFEVSSDRDTGYIATNTLAGSRLNTSLLETPASISVLTKDFLNDIGALNVSQAIDRKSVV